MQHDNVPVIAGMLAASVGSSATSEEIQTLIVSLLALAVREVVYWWRNRRKKP